MTKDELDLFSWTDELSSKAVVGAKKSPEIAVAVESDLPQVIGPKIYSVTELSNQLRDTLRGTFGDILVQGEVADFKGIHRSGHLYFALKDEKSQVRAVMWKGALQKVPFEIKAGLEVICTGKLDYYGGSGSLQIVVEHMEPKGIGALQLKFEQLKAKLEQEGLFDAAKKRPVPTLNWRIGVITSKTTAALQDMLKAFRDRFPVAEIFLFHAAVQGDKAPGEVVAAIDMANRFSQAQAKPLDVLIVARGGGSYEDLFCFNDERIVRAVVASKIPTVSGIGHQIDFTLCDFAADKRAATPSRAAEETVPEAKQWLDRLRELETRFINKMKDALSDGRQRLDQFQNRLNNAAPQKKLELERKILAERKLRFESIIRSLIAQRKSDLHRLSSVFDALSPLKVFDRGYALAKTEAGEVLRSVKQSPPGSKIEVRLSDGQISARVL
jgi:exodeoxyribonuclease VII large subunit